MKTKKTIVLLSAIMLITSVNLWAQQQLTVVVRSFDTSGGISQDVGNAFTDLFISELGSTGRVSIVDRNSFDAIIAEMNFGASDWSNNNNVARLGRAINASHIIQGTVTTINRGTVITVRVLDISKLQFIATPNLQFDYNMQTTSSSDFFNKVQQFVQALALTLANSYQVGEVGPSGGYVFYDKGSYFDNSGWRYLECAPANYEYNRNDGDRLTTMNINRLTGWRYPTKDELNLMYGNLKQWNLGGFRDDWYFSYNPGNSSYNAYVSFQNFNDGRQGTSVRIDNREVNINTLVYYHRAVRQF